MPPSHHSSSSHSSHSHSSSHHSSSSHSSRSHSSSHHSSSSHSSYARSSSYRSHSSSTRPAKVYTYVSGGSGRVINRPMVNQPSGYKYSKSIRRHYCEKHNYSFFPEPWTDSATGLSYKGGFYDENGQYYEDVAFKKGDRYEDVLFACPYCGAKIHQNWKDGEVVKCSSCGGNMNVISFLDTYTQDPEYTEMSKRGKTGNGRGKKSVTAAIIAGITVAAVSFSVVLAAFVITQRRLAAGYYETYSSSDRGTDLAHRNSYSYLHDYDFDRYEKDDADEYDDGYENNAVSNVDIFGKEIYLNDLGDSAYERTGSKDGAAKVIKWDYGAESYYDKESDCYIWFNTDVSPNLWQYWYEGISSDYGDYGWMEYEDGSWFIEESEGHWIELPAYYDRDKLWHIDEE